MATDYPNLTIQIGKRKSELLPCPFCGFPIVNIRVVKSPSPVYEKAHEIICNTCGARSGVRILREDAINDWNTRTPKETFIDNS